MNSKKCKAIRQELRELALRAAMAGSPLPADGLVYRDTQKVIGYTFPKGWQKAQFLALATAGGEWLEQAKRMAKPVYARQAINVPGSFRAIYLRTKQAFA